MLDTQMPRNSQRDDEELCQTPEQEIIDGLKNQIFMMQKGKYGVDYYAEKVMQHEIKEIEQQKQIAKLEKDNKQLYSTLELIKISMELSEEPFYKGMKILNEALANNKDKG